MFHFLAAVILSISYTAMAVPHTPVDKTSYFINCLDYLCNMRIIDQKNLGSFVESLETDKLVNPIPNGMSMELREFNSIKIIHAHDLVQKYIDYARDDLIFINRKEVIGWAKAKIKKGELDTEQKEEVARQTKSADEKMSFNRVKAGKIQMNFGRKDFSYNFTLSVRVTRDFDMQSNQVTEWQWAMIMGSLRKIYIKTGSTWHYQEGNSKFRPYQVNLESPFENWILQENEISYETERIMTSLSWKQIQDFITRLNALSISGNTYLNDLIQDHQAGDQFRLPTEAEWNIVIQDHGKDRLTCGTSSEKYNEWKVDGEVFLGYDNNVFEWLDGGFPPGSDTWLSPYNKIQRAWNHIKNPLVSDPRPGDRGTQILRKPWGEAISRRIAHPDWFNCRRIADTNSSNVASSFRLIRMRKVKAQSLYTHPHLQ